MTLYVVVDIGCLECRIDSTCLGVYTSQQHADAAVGQILAARRATVAADWQARYGKDPDLSAWPTSIDYSAASRCDEQIRVFEVPELGQPCEYPHTTS